MSFDINQCAVDRLLDIIDAGLIKGKGLPVPGGMCVQAAVKVIIGEAHGDDPSCVDPVALCRFGIVMNDANWSSDAVRALGMREFAVGQLGTADNFDHKFFTDKMVMYSINKNVPLALRAALNMPAFPAEHKAKMEECAVNCEKAITLGAAINAASAARYAASNAAIAAIAARYAAINAASNAAIAAINAASNAASAASNAARYAASDQILIDTMKYAVSILIEMDTPGSRFLPLTKLNKLSECSVLTKTKLLV